MIGHLISGVEKIIRSLFPSGKTGERIGGGLLVVIVVAVSMAVPGGILYLAYHISFYLGLAVESFMCYQILATKSLKVESDRVYREIQTGDIARARKAVSMIVGRDTQNLTIEGVTKAAVETVAENTTDGIISPLFYFLLLGPIGAIVYRAGNTMDSMIGYKNERYLFFGRAAARLDDVLNYIPARVTYLLFIIAAFILRLDWRNACVIGFRDANKHPSPNGGYAEATVAGAMHVQLGGYNYYNGKPEFRAYMGDSDQTLRAEHIKTTIWMMYLATIIFAFMESLILLFW